MKVKQEPADDSYSQVTQEDPLYGQVQDMIRDFVSSLPCQENADIIITPKTEDPEAHVDVEFYFSEHERIALHCSCCTFLCTQKALLRHAH